MRGRIIAGSGISSLMTVAYLYNSLHAFRDTSTLTVLTTGESPGDRACGQVLARALSLKLHGLIIGMGMSCDKVLLALHSSIS